MVTLVAQILLVEDETDIADLVVDWLKRDRHSVDIARSGEDALNKLREANYNLLLLDILLPGRSGLDVCSLYRKNAGAAPILMLTARDSIDDKVQAFKLGADDYLTKPFQLRELSARVEALLRRAGHVESEIITIGDLQIDVARCSVLKNSESIPLSPKEFHLLELLARNPNRVFSSREIFQRVWDPESDAMNETVRGHINRLRKKLDTPGIPSLIKNIYGFGYKLELNQ
jgi:DNA-binding response OmpR family regulator